MDSLLESFEDVSLHVVRVELRFGLLILLELRAHVLGDLLLLSLHLLNNSIIVLLLALIFVFNLRHLLTNSTQLLDTGRQFSFLFFDLLLDLLNKAGEFLQGLALIVIHLLFQLRHALNLVLDGGVSIDSLLFLELSKEFIDVTSSAFKDLLGAFEHLDFRLELLERLLTLLVLCVLFFQVGSILTEIVTFQIFGALSCLICLLSFGKGFLEGDLFRLQTLDLLLLLLLLLLDALGLSAID